MSLCKIVCEQHVVGKAAPEGMARVIYSRNPFDTSKHTHEFKEIGEQLSLFDAMSKEMRELPEESVVASINGKIIPKVDWNETLIAEGDVVVIFEIPGGGDDDSKSILRLVLMIIVVIVAPYLSGPAGLGLQGAAAAAFEVAFVVAGSLLVNAILPPVAPTATTSSDFKDSRTYGIDGAKNTSDEGTPVPICYGPFRMAGNIINFHTRNVGNDQYLYLLLNAGEGVSSGLIDIELNEQPIAGFLDAEVQTRLGDSDHELIDWFQNTISPTSVATSVTTSFQTRTTGLIDRFRLDFVCPQGLVQYNDDGSRWSRTVVFDIEYKKTSEPTIWTTLTNTGIVSGSTPGYEYYEYNTYDTEGNIISTIPSERRPDFRDPGDTLVDGRVLDAGGVYVGYRYYWASYSGATQITKQQTSAVRFSFYSPSLDQDTYDIRVKRTTVESTDPKIRDAVTWTDFNEIVEDDVAYNHTALLGLKIRLTDQLSSFPTVTYLNTGRVIKFWDTTNQEWNDGPSTNPAWIVYDAFTNERYGGHVDESRIDIDAWIEWGEYCDNEGLTFQGVFDTSSNLWDASMHIFRAGHARPIKMGTKYSVAIDRAIAPSQMFTVGNIIKGSFNQKWMSLKDRANEVELNYFDETDRFKRRTIKVYDDVIVDGAPQNTASVTMYGIVDETRAAEEATYMLLNNRYLKSTVTFKTPMEAVAVVVGDVFILQHDQPEWSVGGRLAAGSTTTSMEVDKTITFDGAKSYKFMARFDYLTRDVATITGIVGRKLTLSGYAGATNINRLQLTLDSSVDRRITRVDTDTVWVDDVTGLSVTDSVELIETDAIEIRDVVPATSGDLTSIPLVVAAPMPVAPSEHFIYMVGEDTLLESEWRVTKLGIDKNLAVTITGATYDERIYNWTPLTLQPSPNTGQSRVIPHVINLDVVEANVNIGGILRPILDISWDLPPDFENYAGVLVELNVGGAGYKFEKIHRGGLQTTVEANHNDTVSVRVVAMSSDGRFALNSTAPEVTGLVMDGDTIAPAAPTSVALALGTIGLHISWVNPVDADFAACDIKRNTVDNEPGATIVTTTDRTKVSYDDVRATTSTNNYFYWIRSVDSNGNSSAWVATTPTSLQPTAFADGVDATVGLLTNEHHGVPADSDGGNPVFSNANGEFKVWKGVQDITSTCTFSVFSADNLTGTINTAVDTPVTGPKGYYEVTAETSPQDVHNFVVRALTPDAITIDKTFTLTKNKAGEDGALAKTVTLSAESLVFAYDESTGTRVLIGPASIDLTVNEQNTTGSTTWQAWDDTGAVISPVSTLLSSITDGGATVLESDFANITFNAFVTVRATRDGIFDEITIHDLGSGQNGLNNSPALIYQRTTTDSAPTLPSLAATFTFATGAITGLNNGWTDTIPSFTGSNPYLWVTRATASNLGATDSIPAVEWQAAEKLAENGTDGNPGAPGDDGYNTATLTAYKRSASAPTDDPGVSITYTFATAGWTPGNGWTPYIPAGANPVYALSATAYATTATDEVLSADWSSPQLILQDGDPGAPGDDGLNVATVYIYQRTTTDVAPTLPSVTANYTFATGNVTGLNNGWTDTIPTFTGPYPGNRFLWATLATASSISPTDDIAAGEWQNPAEKMSQVGADGYNAITLTAFKKQEAEPTDDPGAFTYTFSTNDWGVGPGNGWLKTVPLGDVNLWALSATARSQEDTDDIIAADWSSVGLIATAGHDGLHVATAYAYQRTATNVAPTLPSVTATFNFITGAITGLNNGWTDTIPASGSNPFLWVTLATASNTEDTDDILTSEWQAAQNLAIDGEGGAVNYAGYYALFETSPILGGISANVTPSFDASVVWAGSQSLKTVASGTDGYVYFGTSSTDYHISIPANQKWILSGYVRLKNENSPDVTDNVQLYLRTPNTGTHYLIQGTVAADNAWHRIEGPVDLSADPSTTAIIRVDNDSWNSVGDTTMHFDGLQLEIDDGTGVAKEFSSPALGGYNTATLTAYKRAGTTPTDDPGVSITYTFATAAWTPGNSWQKTIPAGSQPLYALSATARSKNITDDVVSADWSAPTLILQDGDPGAPGDDGLNVATAYIYQRTATDTPPSVPSATATFTFATGNITGLNNGWTDTVPAAGTDPFLWTTLATASSTGPTDTIGTGEWQTPQHLAEDGAPGEDSLSGLVLHSFDWVRPVTDPMGVWELSQSDIDESDTFINEAGPFNEFPMVLRMVGDNTNKGWFAQWRGVHAYDYQKSYIYYVWVKRLADTATGLYIGYPTSTPTNEVVKTAVGVPKTNPYFVSNVGSAQMTAGKWYLAVGVIWAEGFGAGDQSIAGVYDPDDGSRVHVGIEYQWDTQRLAESYLRVGFYDNAAPTIPPTQGFEFTRPTGWVRDGSEPSVEAVLGAGAIRAINQYLTNEAHPVSSNFDGSGYDLANSGGVHKLFAGITDRTNSATHQIVGGSDEGANWTKTQSGLKMTIVEATGVYSLSSVSADSWITDNETFTLRAIFNGVNYDKVYTITKAKAGSDGGCTLTTLLDMTGVDNTAPAGYGFRVDSDGDMYEKDDDSDTYDSKYTWKGICATTSYECKLIKTSGDDPTYTGTGGTGAGLNQWLVCSSDQQWEWAAPTVSESFVGEISIRRTSDDLVLNTKAVTVDLTISAPSGVVTLSGEVVNDDNEAGNIVGIRFRSNGKVESRDERGYVTIDSATDWIIPNTDAPDLFEVMTDNWVDIGGAGDGFHQQAGSEGQWRTLVFNREWNVQAAGTGGSSSNGMTFDAHIRWNGGSILASGSFSIYSEWFA